MDSSPRLVALSHQRNELHILPGLEAVKNQNGKASDVKVCRVCGDEIRVKENGELFVACHECGFPVCKACYEYERREGNQCCPQCNTRFKRHKGCPTVDGDEYEAGDLEHFEDEFQIKSPKPAFDHQRTDLNSENGEHMLNSRPGGPAFSSFTGSVAGKDLENEREMESNLEWKERVDKWKARQEKKGLISKEEEGNDDQFNEEDSEL